MTAQTNGGRGLGLAVAGQVAVLCGWFFGIIGAVGNQSVGFLGLFAATFGFVASAVACIRARPTLGVAGAIGGWLLLTALVAGVAVFVAMPRTHAWGSLGAFLYAVGVLAAGVYLAHFVLALGLLRARAVVTGSAAAALNAAAIALATAAVLSGSELILAACACALSGHIVLIVGLVRIKERV